MAQDWRRAFFMQARSDFAMFLRLKDIQGVEVCHRLHYLQMATEKLAKGFKCAIGDMQPPPRVHLAFAEFVRKQAKLLATLRRCCNFKTQESYNRYLNGLAPLARQIEELAPQSDVARPNPEYPWAGCNVNVRADQRGATTVFVPAEHLFSNWDLQSAGMRKMLKFIEACFQAAST